MRFQTPTPMSKNRNASDSRHRGMTGQVLLERRLDVDGRLLNKHPEALHLQIRDPAERPCEIRDMPTTACYP